MLRIKLVIPTIFYPKVQYVLDWLMQAWGVPIIITADNPHIVYQHTDFFQDESQALTLPFDTQYFDKKTPFECLDSSSFRLWVKKGHVEEDVDLIGSLYRLLTLLDESQISGNSRDKKGRFAITNLSLDIQERLQLPIADDQALYLKEKIIKKYPSCFQHAIPLWPNAKKFAVLITHDTDAIDVSHPLEVSFNLAKAFLRADKKRFGLAYEGVRSFFTKENLFFTFPDWFSCEHEKKLRSTFFLYASSDRWRHTKNINECRSTILSKRINWNYLRHMANKGWEFGFHCPITATNQVKQMAWGKQYIEEKLATNIYGVRHHYLSLDWYNPVSTLRLYEQAGFLYDSSIAFFDNFGFRAGTSYPYQPYDDEAECAMVLYEIPMVIMDSYFKSSEDALQGIQTVQQSLMKTGGVLNMNWHTETASDKYHYVGKLKQFCLVLSLLNSADVWFTTPMALIKHWQSRSLKIQRLAERTLSEV